MWSRPAISGSAALVAIAFERSRRPSICEEWRPPCVSWEELHRKYHAQLQAAAGSLDHDADAAVAFREFEQTASFIKASPVVVMGSWCTPNGRKGCLSSNGAVVLVGTCHYSTESAARCCAAVNAVRPSCLVLELCTERLLPLLACPAKHRAAWLTAKIPNYLGPGLWERFGIDQQCSLAHQDGLDMVQALDALVDVVQPSFMVALADPTQSERETDDPARDELLAKACIAAIALGHRTVLAVVGAEHVEAVTNALVRLGSAHAQQIPMASLGELSPIPKDTNANFEQLDLLDSLEVELDDGELARACFMSPKAIAAIHALRNELVNSITHEEVAMLRSAPVGHALVARTPEKLVALRQFELKCELIGTSDFLQICSKSNTIIQPASISELKYWWKQHFHG